MLIWKLDAAGQGRAIAGHRNRKRKGLVHVCKSRKWPVQTIGDEPPLRCLFGVDTPIQLDASKLLTALGLRATARIKRDPMLAIERRNLGAEICHVREFRCLSHCDGAG
jgi:hypothetical protein